MIGTLIVKNVTKTYGDNVVLNNISFDVNEGEFFVIVGPSPCGKSVLLNCIMGLEGPTSGRIYMDGTDVTDTPPSERDASMVFQDLALFPHMNVFDNIAFGPRMIGRPKDEIKNEVDEVIGLVRLEGLGDRRITELSGGEKQRVALARSLVLKPRILLFDEPLGEMDPALRERMMVEIKDLHRRVGFTALYVTHDQEQAMTLADRIMVMNKGCIEQIGTPEEVYLNPTTLFVAKFVGELNILNGEITSLENDVLSIKTDVGELKADDKDRFTKLRGKKVVYCIRPEKISIGEKAQSLDNRIEVKLMDQIYKGSTMRYIVQLGNGVEFKSISEGYNLVNFESYIDRDVVIAWKSKDVLVFEA